MNLYFDIAGGASGDMLLSALSGLGFNIRPLEKIFNKAGVKLKITKKRVKFGHTYVEKLYFSYPGRVSLKYKNILDLLRKMDINDDIKNASISSFRNIFDIEKTIHNVKGNNFEFEHLGETDAILEIVGFFAGLKFLNVKDIFLSGIPVSTPAPATLELLKGKKIKMINLGYESITPTAALLLKNACYTDRPFSFGKYAYAAGNYGKNDYLIAYFENDNDFDSDYIVKIESTIDDMNPQLFEDLFDELHKRGAKEVYIEQVIAKKSRPAFVVNILTDKNNTAHFRDILFRYTSTFGIRYSMYRRYKLKSYFMQKITRWGKIKYRVSSSNGFKKIIPEYEDCKRIAKKLKIPLVDVYNKLNVLVK